MYIINPLWFYLIGVAEMIQGFFMITGGLGIGTVAIIGFVYLIEGQYSTINKKPITTILITGLIFCFIGALIPNKETCYSMAIASVATTENLDYAAEAGKNIIDYITEKAIELIEAGE